MLTLSRSLVREIRILLSRALDLPARLYTSCPVHVSAGADGVTIRAQLGDYAAEYRQNLPQPPTEFVTSIGLFKAVEGHKPEPITFETDERQCVIARWQDGPIPRVLSDDPPHADQGAKFPDLPSEWSQNSPELWAALVAAQGTTDANATRYALGCIQLRGKAGFVAATDGSQLFRHGGFTFGWEGEVLIRGLKLFATKELPVDQSVEVAHHDKRIVLRSGSWTFWLPVQEGRFPRVDDVVPVPGLTKTTLTLPPAQRHFLKEHLPKLKCAGFNECVTVDLNGEVAVRSRENETAPPTQLTLTRATYQGDSMRLVSARRYLQRALDLGFSEISLISPEAVIVCRDGRRDYVWMAVDPGSAVTATPDMVDVRSPDALELQHSRSIHHRSSIPGSISCQTPVTPMHQTTNPQEPATNRLPSRKPKATSPKVNLIEQSLNLRARLRELIAETNELVRAAKRQKQQEKLVRSTLASLKQLQAAG